MDELGRDLHDVWTVPAASGLRFLKPGAVGMAIHTEVFVVSGGLYGALRRLPGGSHDGTVPAIRFGRSVD